MSDSSSKLASLRRLLAERFPESGRIPGRMLATGIPVLDQITGGGFPLGAVTEVVCSAPSCGGHLLLAQVLAVTRATRSRMALIDATDSFDPASYPADQLVHLIWVRCHTANEALQAADLLTRDANLAVVAIDLRGIPDRSLRRIPSTLWYRLQRAVEPADLALIIETSQATVPSAQLRVELQNSHSLAARFEEQSSLTSALAPSLHRQRIAQIAEAT